MFTRSVQLRCSCVALVLASGCGTGRPYPALSLPPTARLVEVPPAVAGSSPQSARQDQAIQTVAYRPRNVLVLSGGGANGAYTAGVLKGWTAGGTRPQFDVVTGISTGALIAPFAFLGPEYDEALARSYTELRARDIYRLRPPPALLWSDSVADSTPLRQRIAAEVTPDLLARVARAHAAGRRLYVGTTDLDTKRLVVWDLGAIAAGNDPEKLELFRNILLASASVPGVMPPVPLDVEVNGRRYSELHVDGGVSASLFLQPAMLGRDNPAARGDTTVYVIVAEKLRPPPRPVRRRLFPVAGQSIVGVFQSRFEGDVLKVYLLTRCAGAHFAMTAVPDDSPDETHKMSFNPEVMRWLFDAGYRFGASGTGWRSLPSGLTPEDHPPPRGGVVFTVEEGRPRPQARAWVPAEAQAAPPKGTDPNRLDRAVEDVQHSIQP